MLVPIEVIRNLVKVAERDCTRYALGGVKLERMADGCPVAIATDGRKMAAYTWPEDEGAEYPAIGIDPVHNPKFELLLSAEACAQICGWKMPKKTPKPILLNFMVGEYPDKAGKFQCGATDLNSTFSVRDCAAEGRFPKWRDCFPQRTGTVSVTLDPKFVADVCDIGRKLAADEDARGVTFTVKDAESAVAITVNRADGRQFSAVVMPLARDHDGVQVYNVGEPLERSHNRTPLESIAGEFLRFGFGPETVTVSACEDDAAAVDLHSDGLDLCGRYHYRALRKALAGIWKYRTLAEFGKAIAGTLKRRLPTATPAPEHGELETVPFVLPELAGDLAETLAVSEVA